MVTEMLLLEKYQNFIKYIYPMLINMSGRHRVLRVNFLLMSMVMFLIGFCLIV